VKPRTAAEEYFQSLQADAEYAATYESATRRIAMFDDVIRTLDIRRTELGLTKAELARRADMPAAAVRRLFSQQHKNPTLTTLVTVADVLDLCLSVSMPESERLVTIAPGPSGRPSGASRTRRRTA
jgi:DNA-binding phage protein